MLDNKFRIPVTQYNKREFIVLIDSMIELSNGKMIIIPKGFITDLASVPRIFWWYIGPFGKHTDAAVIHDYLYSSNTVTYGQTFCDKEFLKIMKKDNVNWLKRAIMYRNVRLFGRLFYKKIKIRKDIDFLE